MGELNLDLFVECFNHLATNTRRTILIVYRAHNLSCSELSCMVYSNYYRPWTFHPGTCNTETLSRELTDISGQEWFDLGIQLGVTDASLRNIEANHKGDVQRCKTEMLRVWLQSDPTNSWKELATALERMGKKVLAQSLLEKYNIMKDEGTVWYESHWFIPEKLCYLCNL